jgi:hypothetical protein
MLTGPQGSYLEGDSREGRKWSGGKWGVQPVADLLTPPQGKKQRSPRMLTRCIRGLQFRWRCLGICSGSSCLLRVSSIPSVRCCPCGSQIRFPLTLVPRSETQAVSSSLRRLDRDQRPLDRLGRAELPPSIQSAASHLPDPALRVLTVSRAPEFQCNVRWRGCQAGCSRDVGCRVPAVGEQLS